MGADDLASWLTQIWDEQERRARLEKQLADDFFVSEDIAVEYQWARMTKHSNGSYGSSFSPGAPAPTEVLARIAADRQILALHSGDRDWPCQEGNYVYEPCATLRLLALPYAYRPSYREEWKP